MSQYRSHGYLFNLKMLALKPKIKASQYRSHGYLFNRNELEVKPKGENVSIPFSRLSL